MRAPVLFWTARRAFFPLSPSLCTSPATDPPNTHTHTPHPQKKGAGGLLPPPLALEIEFKKPTLLPNKLALEAVPAGQDFDVAVASAGGYGLRVRDKKGKPILVGVARTTAKAVTVAELAAASKAAK